MLKKVFASNDKKFVNVSDFQLQRNVKRNYDEQFKISGLTLYIGTNWNKDAELKELLSRKGYKQSDFITFTKDKNNKPTTKIERVNYDFVLSHMKHSAKVIYHSIPVIDTETGLQKLNDKNEPVFEKVVKLVEVFEPVIVDGAKVVNPDGSPVLTQKFNPDGSPVLVELTRTYYSINTLLTELRKCEVSETETRTILK